MIRKICSASRIDINFPHRRSMPRPPVRQQEGYVDAFDATTLFYDVYRYRDRIMFSGPPLWDLRKFAQAGAYNIDWHTLRPVFLDQWKVQRSFANTVATGDRISITSELANGVFPISPDENDLFEGRKVLFTLSKNNSLQWIADWAEFHVRSHGVDAVLLYDNKSDLYDPATLLNALAGIEGIKVAVVMSWPFKYGPSGGYGPRWDSDFCQIGAIAHARRRFLADCRGMINADIDELVVCEEGGTIFDHLDASPVGAVSFSGLWLEAVAGIPQPRHRHFRYHLKKPVVCPRKWAIVPAAVPDDVQANVHDFGSGFEPDFLESVRYRHFVAINDDWKYKRAHAAMFKGHRHTVDAAYVQVMKAIGWAL